MSKDFEFGHLDTLAGKNVKIRIFLSAAFVSLSILGTTAWSKSVSLPGKTTAVVGIQFKDMNNTDRRLLDGYHYGSDGEQNLIWSLWDSLMEK